MPAWPDVAFCPLCNWCYRGYQADMHYNFHMENHPTVDLSTADHRFLKSLQMRWWRDDREKEDAQS